MNLPNDILRICFSYLTTEERYPLLFVNKRFNSLADLENKPKVKELVKFAARTGSVSLAVWLHPLIEKDFVKFTQVAAKQGHQNLLEWALEKKFKLTKWTFRGAAQGKTLNVFKWLRKQKCPWDKMVMLKAAKKGHLEIMQWLKHEGCSLDQKIYEIASRKGHLNVVKWLDLQDCPQEKRIFAESGNLDLIKYLYIKGASLTAATFSGAARGGHIDILKWLNYRGCPSDKSSFKAAARNGHFEVLQWMVAENLMTAPLEGAFLAAVHGHIKSLMFILDNGGELPPNICNLVAAKGHLEVLKFLIDKQHPIDEHTFHLASEGGHLQVLDYLISQECPWDKIKCPFIAAKNGHHQALKFLIAKGGIITEDSIKIAKKRGHLLVIKYFENLRHEHT